MIDPDVDEAGHSLVTDLLYTGGLEKIGLVSGLGVATPDHPQTNLTGNPYFHKGLQAVLLFSDQYTSMSEAHFFDWEYPSLHPARHPRQNLTIN